MIKSDVEVLSPAREYNMLSDEQKLFIDTSLTGANILVDACIGSGKTTAIQSLCNALDDKILNRTRKQPRVLYLTYNTLLKIDAKRKILNRNVFVTNYHGFAYAILRAKYGRVSSTTGPGDLIQLFKRCWPDLKLFCMNYDVMLLDEYQDIDQEIAEMLLLIKSVNPYMQIIAVGDMCQKVSDKTCLDARGFISDLLGNGCNNLEFTQCFRLPEEYASEIGSVWGKKIRGVNQDCRVETMTFDEAFDFLSYQDPGEILCLGANKGPRANMQNKLESRCPDVYNKTTLWSKISDGEGYNSKNLIEAMAYSAIFTTYDSSKGMERPICMLFDWDLAYWETRITKPGVNMDIMRNIFLVAASRGKNRIVFVRDEEKKARKSRYDWGFTDAGRYKKPRKKDIMLTWDVLRETQSSSSQYEDMNIPSMFDFKYIEHVEAAYHALDINEIKRSIQVIDVPNFDGLIDLSPCIGMFQEVAYFKNTSIDQYIEEFFMTHPRVSQPKNYEYRTWSLDQKILYLASLELNQARYFRQVSLPLVTDSQADMIKARLKSELPDDAITQKRCQITFEHDGRLMFSAVGMCDVLYDDKIWELKFVSALSHVHFLQCAMYMIGHDIEVGRLWNVRNNQMFEIKIPDRQKFLDCVIMAVTKGLVTKYSGQSFDANNLGKIGAFDYYNRVWEFCVENFETCERLDSAIAAGQDFNSIQVEQFFEDAGAILPVPGDLYMKYWKQLAEKIRLSAGL